MIEFFKVIFTGIITIFFLLVTPLSNLEKQPALASQSNPEYKKHFILKTTAYSNDPISINVPEWRDGFTATMTKARKGVCAADWCVFPIGTVLDIPGYGKCRIEDRGAAVKGFHVDLFFPTYEEAKNWGVKFLKVKKIS